MLSSHQTVQTSTDISKLSSLIIPKIITYFRKKFVMRLETAEKKAILNSQKGIKQRETKLE